MEELRTRSFLPHGAFIVGAVAWTGKLTDLLVNLSVCRMIDLFHIACLHTVPHSLFLQGSQLLLLSPSNAIQT